MALVLAPWNDSMQIGMGFNSYTQKACLDGAMKATLISEADDTAKKSDSSSALPSGSVSQVVSYSSRIVDKLSDIVDAMNISYGSSIKKGTIEISGNTSAIDEDKIKESDLNAVVTVRVINQMSNMYKFDFNSIFQDASQVDGQKFNEKYGDCFISGYIAGGDFTGVVSMKVLDITKKAKITTSIKSNLGGSADAKEFTLDSINLTGNSSLSSSVKDTETTVGVSWTGGGQIKDPATPWDIDSMYAAAASFPSKVAQTPQKTFAILTKYSAVTSFLQSKLGGIEVVNYDGVLSYTADLFENFMEYKQLVKSVQLMLADPDKYAAQNATNNHNAIGLDIPTLLAVKAAMRHEMDKIVEVVDLLAKDPKAIKQRNPTPIQNDTVTKIINEALGQPDPPLDQKSVSSAKNGKSRSNSSFTSVAPPPRVTPIDPPKPLFDALIAPEWFGNQLPKLKEDNADSSTSDGSNMAKIDFNKVVPPLPQTSTGTQVATLDSRIIKGTIAGADYGGSDITSKIKSLYDEWVSSPQTQGRPFQFQVDPKIIGNPASTTQGGAPDICSVIFSVSIGGQEIQTETFVERQQITGQVMIVDFARAFIYPPMTPPLAASTERKVSNQPFRAVDYVMTPPAGEAGFEDPKSDFVDFVELDRSSIPTEVAIQVKDGAIIGVRTEYSGSNKNAKVERQDGNTTDGSPTALTLRSGEHIVKVDLWSGTTNKSDGVVIIKAQFITDQGRLLKVNESAGTGTQTTSTPPFGGWVLKGFWGASSTAMKRLGCIWGPVTQVVV